LSERGDRLRSLLREGARAVRARAAELAPIARVRQTLSELRLGRVLLPAEALRAQLLRVPELDSLWLEVRASGVQIDASFSRGEPVRLTLVPVAARFAPRGAKELIWRVEPPERASGARAADLAAAVSVAVARALWAPVLPPDDGAPPDAIVERDPGAELRVDLRTIPVVRKLRGPAQALLDALALTSLGAEDGALQLGLRLPGMPPGSGASP
jgi:hypothetical protein